MKKSKCFYEKINKRVQDDAPSPFFSIDLKKRRVKLKQELFGSIMENLTCLDTNGILSVWNYTECTNDSPDELKQQRGIIKDNQGHVVAPSFGFTHEYNTQQIEDIEKQIGEKSNWDFYHAVEGTLLRLFYYEGVWFLATHKKLDAFKSRWSCKQTFGELFVDALKEVFQREDAYSFLQGSIPQDRVYYFLIRSNQQNRIVCHAHRLSKKESIIFLGHKKDTDNFVPYSGDYDIEIMNTFEAPKKLPELSTVNDIVGYVANINPFQYQGVIAFSKQRMASVKIVNDEYQKYYRVRGNNPNIRFRYLEVRQDLEQRKLLYMLYPKFTFLFDEYESTIYDIARMIYHFYVNRYIKKQYVTLPREEYMLLKKCHQWYLQDRQNHLYTHTIMTFLSEEPPLNVYKMIKRFHLERGTRRFQPFQKQSQPYDIPIPSLQSPPPFPVDNPYTG